MKFTAAEVIQYVRQEEIKFIRLAFCDISGRQKNIAIMSGELERAFESGIPPKVVQQILGHSSLEMTMDLYTHVTEDVQSKEIQKLAVFF